MSRYSKSGKLLIFSTFTLTCFGAITPFILSSCSSDVKNPDVNVSWNEPLVFVQNQVKTITGTVELLDGADISKFHLEVINGQELGITSTLNRDNNTVSLAYDGFGSVGVQARIEYGLEGKNPHSIFCSISYPYDIGIVANDNKPFQSGQLTPIYYQLEPINGAELSSSTIYCVKNGGEDNGISVDVEPGQNDGKWYIKLTPPATDGVKKVESTEQYKIKFGFRNISNELPKKIHEFTYSIIPERQIEFISENNAPLVFYNGTSKDITLNCKTLNNAVVTNGFDNVQLKLFNSQGNEITSDSNSAFSITKAAGQNASIVLHYDSLKSNNNTVGQYYLQYQLQGVSDQYTSSTARTLPFSLVSGADIAVSWDKPLKFYEALEAKDANAVTGIVSAVNGGDLANLYAFLNDSATPTKQTTTPSNPTITRNGITVTKVTSPSSALVVTANGSQIETNVVNQNITYLHYGVVGGDDHVSYISVEPGDVSLVFDGPSDFKASQPSTVSGTFYSSVEQNLSNALINLCPYESNPVSGAPENTFNTVDYQIDKDFTIDYATTSDTPPKKTFTIKSLTSKLKDGDKINFVYKLTESSRSHYITLFVKNDPLATDWFALKSIKGAIIDGDDTSKVAVTLVASKANVFNSVLPDLSTVNGIELIGDTTQDAENSCEKVYEFRAISGSTPAIGTHPINFKWDQAQAQQTRFYASDPSTVLFKETEVNINVLPKQANGFVNVKVEAGDKSMQEGESQTFNKIILTPNEYLSLDPNDIQILQTRDLTSFNYAVETTNESTEPCLKFSTSLLAPETANGVRPIEVKAYTNTAKCGLYRILIKSKNNKFTDQQVTLYVSSPKVTKQVYASIQYNGLNLGDLNSWLVIKFDALGCGTDAKEEFLEEIAKVSKAEGGTSTFTIPELPYFYTGSSYSNSYAMITNWGTGNVALPKISLSQEFSVLNDYIPDTQAASILLNQPMYGADGPALKTTWITSKYTTVSGGTDKLDDLYLATPIYNYAFEQQNTRMDVKFAGATTSLSFNIPSSTNPDFKYWFKPNGASSETKVPNNLKVGEENGSCTITIQALNGASLDDLRFSNTEEGTGEFNVSRVEGSTKIETGISTQADFKIQLKNYNNAIGGLRNLSVTLPAWNRKQDILIPVEYSQSAPQSSLVYTTGSDSIDLTQLDTAGNPEPNTDLSGSNTITIKKSDGVVFKASANSIDYAYLYKPLYLKQGSSTDFAITPDAGLDPAINKTNVDPNKNAFVVGSNKLKAFNTSNNEVTYLTNNFSTYQPFKTSVQYLDSNNDAVTTGPTNTLQIKTTIDPSYKNNVGNTQNVDYNQHLFEVIDPECLYIMIGPFNNEGINGTIVKKINFSKGDSASSYSIEKVNGALNPNDSSSTERIKVVCHNNSVTNNLEFLKDDVNDEGYAFVDHSLEDNLDTNPSVYNNGLEYTKVFPNDADINKDTKEVYFDVSLKSSAKYYNGGAVTCSLYKTGTGGTIAESAKPVSRISFEISSPLVKEQIKLAPIGYIDSSSDSSADSVNNEKFNIYPIFINGATESQLVGLNIYSDKDEKNLVASSLHEGEEQLKNDLFTVKYQQADAYNPTPYYIVKKNGNAILDKTTYYASCVTTVAKGDSCYFTIANSKNETASFELYDDKSMTPTNISVYLPDVATANEDRTIDLNDVIGIISSNTSYQVTNLKINSTSVKGITMDYNTNLKNIVSLDVSLCPKLETISIHDCNISTLDLRNNKELKSLTLENMSELNTIPGLEDLTKLEQFSLDNCTAMKDSTSYDLSKTILKSIVIKDTNVPNILFPSSLTSLIIAGENESNKWVVANPNLSVTTGLKELYISNATFINPGSLFIPSTVEEIQICNTNITTIDLSNNTGLLAKAREKYVPSTTPLESIYKQDGDGDSSSPQAVEGTLIVNLYLLFNEKLSSIFLPDHGAIENKTTDDYDVTFKNIVWNMGQVTDLATGDEYYGYNNVSSNLSLYIHAGDSLEDFFFCKKDSLDNSYFPLSNGLVVEKWHIKIYPENTPPTA
ncbi:MAG: hypothetical protein LBB39_00140 [Mycoplasmataceae bacterium]|nr:hypothetical protein [Mycoplasmataceae bacterium]